MSAANLVNQNEALIDFLDDLLCEDVDEPTPVNVPEPSETVVAEKEPVPEAVIVEQEEVVQPAPVDKHGRQLIIPDWGREAFAAMVFKVRDLSLALPVQELAGVIDWQTAGVEQQAGSLLLLGQSQHKGKTVNVVDTARFIFPEEKLTTLAAQGGTALSRIILINNGKIGLACEEVYELIDIQPDQVTWRSENTRRKWLAGTMLEEMIVLLDAATAADILTRELGL